MRKLIVLSFVSLDGVMQAPGGQDEDRTGGFEYGGWSFPYFDEFLDGVMGEQMGHDFDLLLGRKTFNLFASYWPNADPKDPAAAPLNKATKYVATRQPLKTAWQNSFRIEGELAEGVRKLKAEDGPELQVHGSGNMIQTLLKNDLVDEFWLKIYPITLGNGKRLFAEGTIPAAFELTECTASPNGVIVANYRRAGDVKTGSF
ncbi:MAG TPA: dihydrofolate reductase family protein [Candidatus Kapabacteria bacterium]|jgi:dihydrofolate reductase